MSELYLAERFWPAGGLAELEAAADRLRAVIPGQTEPGEQVRYVGSVLVPTDEVAFLLFEAPHVAAVRALSERASVALDRIVECYGFADEVVPAPRTAFLEEERMP